MTESSTLAQEWQVLQQAHDQHEKSALGIKLTAVILCFASLAVVIDLLLVGVLLLILWLQEAILRTTQARLGTRLLELEVLTRRNSDTADQADHAFQLHSEWAAHRGNSVSLLREYASHAFRPTIAFPYFVLILVLLAALSMSAG